MGNSQIEFKNVTFKYDSQAEPTLKNIDLTINQGERVLIAGPSGSGKSTLGNLINGLIPHSLNGELSGQVLVDGTDVAKSSISELSLKVGTVLQDSNNQFVGLTTAEDIAFGEENDNDDVTQMHHDVKDWAQQLDLELLLDQSPQRLSGGQKQRVAMAGVLIDNAANLLFDEPLAALDPATGQATMQLINYLHQKYHMTMIIIEHRIEEVLTQPIDRLVVLNNGQIVANDTPANILKQSTLNQLGLREPLYLEAIKAAHVNLSGVEHIDDPNQVTAPDIASSLTRLADQKWPASDFFTQPQLELKCIDFQYDPDHVIFKNLDLTVHHGERIAIVGRNGVGKSTLSKLIAGFIKPDQGKIKLDDQSLSNQSIKERADQIGYIMQDPDKMISKVMIRDEVSLGLQLRGIDQATINQRVDEALKVCGLYKFRNWPISALSFGQKKRVTIASILVLKPQILILDEPTAGQDFEHYQQMMNFLMKLNQQGMTMIFITHDMHLMLEYANRTVVLGDHHILADEQPSQVLSDRLLCQKANLRPTSLYTLAQRFDLNPLHFTQSVINYELGSSVPDEQ